MLAYLFVLLAVAVRFMPHPWMFTPVAGALLFFGARGSRRQLWIPVALLAASYVILTKVIYAYPFSGITLPAGRYAAVLWLARICAATKARPPGGRSLASSVSFFPLSNFATWACLNMYPKNLGGRDGVCAGTAIFRNASGDLILPCHARNTRPRTRSANAITQPA
jgi:hypothetical protein